MTETAMSLKRTLAGHVASNKMDKIVTVLIESHVKHPLYGKYVVRSKKYHTHNGASQYNGGDKIEITKSRPLSRTEPRVMSRLFEAAHVT